EAAKVSSRDLNWAQGVALFTVEGTVEVRRAPRSTFSGFDALLRTVKNYPAFSRNAEQRVDEDIEQTPVLLPAEDEPKRIERRFPVARFWQETIVTEEEIQPEIVLVASPKRDTAEATLTFECEDGLPELGSAEGQSVA